MAPTSRRAVLGLLFREGNCTGLSRGGTLNILVDIACEHTDEVYSRDDVVATE